MLLKAHRHIEAALPKHFKRALRIAAAPLERQTKIDLLRCEADTSHATCRLGPVTLIVDRSNQIDYFTLYGSLVDRMFDTNVAGAAVLDVGAHKGYFGARCLYDGARTVHSYEPASANFRALQRASHAVPSWHVHHVAVSDDAGPVRLHLSDQSWGHSVVAIEGGHEVGSEVVPTLPLSLALARVSKSGDHVHVKINVEGAAGTMLCSTTAEDWTATRTLWLDYEPTDPISWERIEAHLRSCGLELADIDGRRRLLKRQDEPT